MKERARKSVRLVVSPHQPIQFEKTLTSNDGRGGEHGALAMANGRSQDRSILERAKDLLARVIQQTGANPDAPFASEALEAAALIEEHDLATFSRYRRNLRQRHISTAVLDSGLRRLKTRRRSAARVTAVAKSAGAPIVEILR
jgi:hypothetical protein